MRGTGMGAEVSYLVCEGQVSVRTGAATLVVATMVAMVALPPLIDRDDLVLENGLGDRLVPRAPVLEVQALEEGTAKPVG